MKVKELMERVGSQQTGRVVAYIKDGLEEINELMENNTKLVKLDITENKRFYSIPAEALKVVDIRVKNHLNSKDEYRSIPRMLHKPKIKDADNT